MNIYKLIMYSLMIFMHEVYNNEIPECIKSEFKEVNHK